MNQPNDSRPPDSQREGTNGGRGPTWRLPLLLGIAIGLLAVIAMVGRRLPQRQAGVALNPPTVTPSDQSVSLQVVYDDGTEKRFPSLPWSPGMTVARALDLAAERPPGLSYAQQGSGPRALLTRIDQLTNGGPGDDSRNWIYRVNGQLADKSFAAYSLKPGDVILWTFAKYE